MGKIKKIKINRYCQKKFLILNTLLNSYFEGHLPILVTSDPEIIQDIFIKQYANFSARKVNEKINPLV